MQHPMKVLSALIASVSSVLAAGVHLPYDNTCPVIHTNDGNIDVYTLEYAMALASAGDISLVGIVADAGTGYGTKPKANPKIWESGRQMYADIVGKARRSGMINIPDPVAGANWALDRPASGRIDDTIPLDTPGSRLIAQEARKATRGKPLLVVTGGALTCVADAYLLDNSIADSLVVAALQGSANDMGGYNGAIDGWASYIVLQKLRYVQFIARQSIPRVPKKRLSSPQIPSNELKRFMVDKDQQGVNLPADKDADAPPMISIMRPDYALAVKRVSFGRWKNIKTWGNGLPQVPVFKDDAAGRGLVITKSSKAISTEEWWRALRNPAAYTGPVAQQAPFHGRPLPIPCTIEAEHFDWGGKGYAFHNAVPTAWPICRVDDSDLNLQRCGDSGGGFNLARLATGDWYEYTVAVATTAAYSMEVRVACEKGGGKLRLELDGEDRSGVILIPNTGGSQNWQTVVVGNISLTEGEHVLRIVVKTGGLALNHLKFVISR